MLDVVSLITHQAVQINYLTPLTRGIKFVRTAWCVIVPATSKK